MTADTSIAINTMQVDHWPAVAEIYREGIATGHATFQQEVPSWEEWDKDHLASCRLVAVQNGEVVGWAALTPVSGRCVYAGVAEVSVYVSAQHRGKGIGTRLLQALITASEQNDIWSLQAGIFPENKASIRIHESLGFSILGTREKLGKMNGQWRDVVFMEKRSQVVGVD